MQPYSIFELHQDKEDAHPTFPFVVDVRLLATRHELSCYTARPHSERKSEGNCGPVSLADVVYRKSYSFLIKHPGDRLEDSVVPTMIG